MQADIAEAIKASASESVTAVTSAETVYDFGHFKDQKSGLGQRLYNILKPEEVELSHMHNVHRDLTNTIMLYYRIISARITEAHQKLITLDPTAIEAVQLKEEISFLDSIIKLLKKITEDNTNSADKIKKIEKTIENIIAFGESYAVSKAGGYASHYIILLTGLVGIPALGVTLAFPATQALGALLAKKYYQNKREKAEIKGQKIAADTTFSLHQIAINFLEFKKIPKELQSPSQLEYLDNLKKYVAVEPDINLIVESINNFYMTNGTYTDPQNKFSSLRRFKWIESHIAELNDSIKKIGWQLDTLAKKTSFTDQNAATQAGLRLESAQLTAYINLLKSEQKLLKPTIEDLLKRDLTINPPRRNPVEHKKAILQQLQDEKTRGARTFHHQEGVKASNLQGAKDFGFNLGGVLSPTGVIAPFSPTESTQSDTSITSSVLEDISSPLSPVPSSLEQLDNSPDSDDDSSDEEMLENEAKTLRKTDQSPKPAGDDFKSTSKKLELPKPSITLYAQNKIVAKLEKYINQHASFDSDGRIKKPKHTLSSLRFTGDSNLLKARSALVIKLVVKERPTHDELLDVLHKEKSKYQEKHTHGGKSGFLKLISKIEKIIHLDLKNPLENQDNHVASFGSRHS